MDPSAPPAPASLLQPSNYATDQAASDMTHSILTDAHVIIERAEAEGRDPEVELREMVGRHVLDGVITGASWAQESAQDGASEAANGRRYIDQNGHSESKRPRFDDATEG